MKYILKIIVIYLLVFMLGTIAFVNFTSFSVQEALFTTALIEMVTIVSYLIKKNI